MNTHPSFKSIVLGVALFVFSIVLPILFHPAEALAVGSVITGSVTDASGAAIPEAAVKVLNPATGVEHTVTTNAVGIFRISEPPGVYDVSIEKSGFKVAQFTGITLTVDQVLTLNSSLEIGAETQMVEVAGKSIAPVDLQDGQLSNVIEQREVLDMPLITRDPYALTLLSPGVIASTSRFGGFSANGTREKDNNFLLDGTDNNDTDVPGAPDGLSSANPDSIQEFRVITNNFSAEYGRNDGAIIDVITKSGTNAIHGDAYWFGRYDALGARDFFNETPGTPKNPYERNIFGASAGGPIVKDKTFWFANYEGDRFITALTDFSNVPTAAFRTGVFQAIEPGSGTPSTVDISSPTAPNNGIGFALDPTIQKVLALYPLPTPGTPLVDNTEGLYYFPSEDRTTFDIFTAKIDHHINDRNTLSGRYTFQRVNDPVEGDSNFLPPNLGGYGTSQRTQSMTVDWSTTLRSNLVNDFRFGGNRTTDPFFCTGTKVLDQFLPLDPFGRGTDLDLQDGYGAGPAPFGCQVLGDLDEETRHTGTYQIVNGLVWIRGKHSMKFGFEGRDIYSNSYDDFSSRPQDSFEPEYSFGEGVLQNLPPAFVSDPVLNDEAATLLGLVTSQSQQEFFSAAGTRVGDDLEGFRQKELGLYAQDAWKVRPNLTFNYGLRWEYFGVPYEAHNNFTNLFADPSGPGPFTFTIVGPGHRSAWQNEYANFEPRVGFAWDPFKTGKTSVRGAYGIFHTRAYGNLFENARANPPFQQPFSSEPFEPLTGLPTPPTIPTSATVTNYDPVTGTGGFVFPDLFDPLFHSPYSQNWNLGIQRQITESLQVEVNYVGVRGLRLFRVVDGNPPQPGLVSALEAYCKDPTNPYGCVDSATESTLQGYNLWIGQEEGTLPFDAVNNNAFEENCCTPGADLIKSIAKSYYNGLQVNVTQRLSHGVNIHGAYTWSHALDDASDPLDAAAGNRNLPRNSFKLNNEYGNSDFDVRHRLSIDFVYQPNLGRGRGYLNHGVTGRVMEGWELTGIATFQTGQPYDIFGDQDSQHTGLSDRAMIIGPRGIPPGADKTQTGPALTSFTNAPYDSESNLTRNQFFGPGINNWNVAFLKDQSIKEGIKLQIRFEFYNLFNRVQFGQPGNDIASPGTFGISTAEVEQPDATTGARQIQFGLKLLF
jgi:hypothetical protein